MVSESVSFKSKSKMEPIRVQTVDRVHGESEEQHQLRGRDQLRVEHEARVERWWAGWGRVS